MRLTKRKLGWIGVDVGTSTVKIAQVLRGKQGWKIAAAAVVPRQNIWAPDLDAETQAISSVDEMKAAKSLQEAYRGRQVAATLPMGLCDIHRLERVLDREPNPSKIIRQSIETATQKSIDHLQCDFWSAPATGDQPGWTQTLTVPSDWTNQVCVDIAKVGWSCQKIDGLPQAMARAVNMIQKGMPSTPLAALDWGSHRATLCFVEAGQPAYVRCLKNSGFRNILDALMEKLQVTEVEAQKLLEKFGLATDATDGTREIAHLVQEIICDQLNHVIEEIKRSFSHYSYLRRAKAPKQLYLFGGGAMINQLATHLSEQLQLDASLWKLPSTERDDQTAEPSNDCLLAPAIALSALAWGAS